MGKKISQLTIASTPYEGEELFAMVEDSATVAAPISSFQSFLSGQDHLASPHKNNNFVCDQTIAGTLSSEQLNVGTQNNASLGTGASIAGGFKQTATSNHTFIGGGCCNTTTGNKSAVGVGLKNANAAC